MKHDGIKQGTRREERELEKQVMQNEKGDRTKGQNRVTGENTHTHTDRTEETTKKKRNQENKQEYTKTSKEIIKYSTKTEK
jgi:hypothetical protein